MAIVLVGNKLSRKDLKGAREEFPQYIKITADLEQEIVLIGGEYHADAEKFLIKDYSSKQKDIWGGGYNVSMNTFEVNAIINLRPITNDSTDILNPEIRKSFLELVRRRLRKIKSLL